MDYPFFKAALSATSKHEASFELNNSLSEILLLAMEFSRGERERGSFKQIASLFYEPNLPVWISWMERFKSGGDTWRPH